MLSSKVDLGSIWNDALASICQPVSSFSHLAGFAFAAVASVRLVHFARRRGHAAPVAIYVLTVAGALAISGVYHALDRSWALRQMMRQIDHMAIWFLIAGTFTAVHGVACRGFWRRGMLAIVWTYALVGTILQVFWFDAFSGNLGLALYLGMGWIGIASILKLGKQMGYSALAPMFAGGLAFSIGAIMEAADVPVIVPQWIGPHEFFHLAVLLGLALHWRFVAVLLQQASPPPDMVAPFAHARRRRPSRPYLRLRRHRTRGVARYRPRRSLPGFVREPGLS